MLHAVIDKQMIPFAAYTTAGTPNPFHLARQSCGRILKTI